MNNGKYHTESYKQLQADKVDRLYGARAEYTKICECCGKDFPWEGRKNTKAYKRARFCTRSCANNRQAWWNDNATGYRTIAFRYWPKQCMICGFDKIVAIHHNDNNHSNNDPNNLIPLCPNHHEMIHSKWKNEVQPLVDNLIQNNSGR